MTDSTHSKITGTTTLFGCMAYPAGHVRAPMIFNSIFQEQNLDKVMVAMSVPAEGLAAYVEGLRALTNFKGAAVTIPHKMPLAALCDELGAGAQAAEAVNAVAFTADRRLIGDNFDGEGFVAGLRGENPCNVPEAEIFTGKKVDPKKRPESTISNMLTAREIEVLKLISKEHSSPEIAEILNISQSTVDTYRKNLLKKTNVKNSVGLAMYAVKNKIV